MLTLIGIVAIIGLFLMRDVIKRRRETKQWKHIDKDWRPERAARRSTNEFEGKS